MESKNLIFHTTFLMDTPYEPNRNSQNETSVSVAGAAAKILFYESLNSIGSLFFYFLVIQVFDFETLLASSEQLGHQNGR